MGQKVVEKERRRVKSEARCRGERIHCETRAHVDTPHILTALTFPLPQARLRENTCNLLEEHANCH